jgi:hypothetical protein
MQVLSNNKIQWNQKQQCKFVIAELRRQKQEDLEFKASLSYTARLCLKKKKI